MTIDSISMGDVLVYTTSYGRKFGVKALDYTYTAVDGTETKLFIVQSGRIADNRWVPNEGTDNVSVSTVENLQGLYNEKWVPSAFKKGDFLTSSDGKVFLYESDTTVWRLSVGEDGYGRGAMHGSLKSRESSYGKLKVLNTAAGTSFRQTVEELLK